MVATHDKNDVLPFADKMIVLNKGEIIAKDTPENLYNNPENPLIASFFGEYNIIESTYVYANQLKVVDNSDINAKVLKSFYNGKNYLVEAMINENVIFFEHDSKLEKGKDVFLKIIK